MNLIRFPLALFFLSLSNTTGQEVFTTRKPPSWNPIPAMWLRLSCWVSFGSADFRAGHNNIRSSQIRSVACSRYHVNLYKPVSWSGCQKRNCLHHQVCLVPFVYSLLGCWLHHWFGAQLCRWCSAPITSTLVLISPTSEGREAESNT